MKNNVKEINNKIEINYEKDNQIITVGKGKKAENVKN